MRKILFVCCLMGVVFGQASSFVRDTDVNMMDWKSYYRQGESYYHRRQFLKALEKYRHALKQHYSDALVHAIASCYYERGYYRKSIELYRDFLENDSSEQKIDLLAKCYDKLELPDSALMYRRQIAERNIENQSNILLLVQDCLSLEIPDTALYFLDRYTAVDSTDLTVNKLRAYIFYRTGNYHRAIDLYEQIKDAGDNQTSTNYYLGLSYAQADSLSKAYDCLELAVEQTRRRNAHILCQFGIVSSKLGDLSVGNQALDEAIDLLQPDKTLMGYLYETKASNFTKMRQVDEAIACYKRSLEYNPHHYMCIFHIGYLFHLKKDIHNEKVFFERFLGAVKKANKEDEYKKSVEYAVGYLKSAKEEDFFRGGFID